MSRSSLMVIRTFFPEGGSTAPRFPLLKSYFAFILFHLVTHGLACGNDPNVVPSPRVDHYQYAAKGVHSNSDIALLTLPEILKRHGVWIFEDRECIGKRDAVFGLILFGLRFVTFKHS